MAWVNEVEFSVRSNEEGWAAVRHLGKALQQAQSNLPQTNYCHLNYLQIDCFFARIHHLQAMTLAY